MAANMDQPFYPRLAQVAAVEAAAPEPLRGMTLAEMLADDQPSTLKVGRGEVNLRTIVPELVSSELMDRINFLNKASSATIHTLQDAAELLDTQARVVLELVTWWDVVGADGQIVPLELEAVKKLPKGFHSLVIQHVISGRANQGEAQPGRETNEDSGDTSSRQAKSATARNGIPGSSRQTASTSRSGNFSQASRSKGSAGRKRR